MPLFDGIILGILQGLTEFFPISSSGHLVIVPWMLNMSSPSIFFDVFVHLGTILAIFVFWFKRIKAIFIKTIMFLAKGKIKIPEDPDSKIGMFIIIGSISTGILGFLGKDFFETVFGLIKVITICLFINSIMLFLTRFTHEKREIKDMGIKDALIIGLFQGIAILPGVSRSGACISGALFMGLKRDLAFEFAFLLSIPTILFAFILKLKDALEIKEAIFSPSYLSGFGLSFIVGLLTLASLSFIVRRGRIYLFSYYSFMLGLIMLCYLPR